MIKRYSNISLAIGAPGLLLQSFAASYTWPPSLVLTGNLLLLAGTALLLAGLAFYAKAKGRHPAWGLFGLLSIVGVIVLGILPDRSAQSAAQTA